MCPSMALDQEIGGETSLIVFQSHSSGTNRSPCPRYLLFSLSGTILQTLPLFSATVSVLSMSAMLINSFAVRRFVSRTCIAKQKDDDDSGCTIVVAWNIATTDIETRPADALETPSILPFLQFERLRRRLAECVASHHARGDRVGITTRHFATRTLHAPTGLRRAR